MLATPEMNLLQYTHIPALSEIHFLPKKHIPALPEGHFLVTKHILALPEGHFLPTKHIPALPEGHFLAIKHIPALPEARSAFYILYYSTFQYNRFLSISFNRINNGLIKSSQAQRLMTSERLNVYRNLFQKWISTLQGPLVLKFQIILCMSQ